MKFDAFDKTEQERFAAEVKERWGGTAAYQEYQQHRQNGDTGDSAGLMAQFAVLGKLKALAPTAPEVQAAIRGLQQFITEHFLHLHAGNFCRAGRDVCGRRSFSSKHRQSWRRRHGSVRRQGHPRLLRKVIFSLYCNVRTAQVVSLAQFSFG